VLSVQDFGCGIPEDKLDDIFINFGNLAEHQKANPTGRGLGLSICKAIIEQMGGNVHVESQVGRGTSFNLTFKVRCDTTNNQLVVRSLQNGLDFSASSSFQDVSVN
jgi:signal transduction histidine kinase